MFNLQTIGQLESHQNKIVEEVVQHGWSVVRGLFNREELREKLNLIYEAVNKSERLPSAGVPPEAIQKNVFKWSIGASSTSQGGIARMMLTVYNPLFAENTYGLHSIFSRLIEVRDALAQHSPLTDVELAPDRWNSCRVQIYPAGGGFMSAHIDSRAASNLPPKQKAYIQLVLLLSERGLDYKTGGAFVYLNEDIFDSENNTKTGDIIVYDGNTMHGVADIDPAEVFNCKNLGGRAVALATIYDKR